MHKGIYMRVNKNGHYSYLSLNMLKNYNERTHYIENNHE
ncbi:Uncharacterised protein [Citrobacter freundii]|jgi:hypothetical protein|nr:Uncharacterised protein [Citrobacter freundii]